MLVVGMEVKSWLAMVVPEAVTATLRLDPELVYCALARNRM
jgi:hypothetical protein